MNKQKTQKMHRENQIIRNIWNFASRGNFTDLVNSSVRRLRHGGSPSRGEAARRIGPFPAGHTPGEVVIEMNPWDESKDEIEDVTQDLPLGMGMALAQNEPAMERFAALSEAEQRSVIQGARQVHSRQEMRDYVERIGQAE